MIKNKYDHYEDNQLEKYKVKLHKELFWLLLYKDPEQEDQFGYVDYDSFFNLVMLEINGLNELLFCPPKLIKLMALLEAAYIETQKDEFNFHTYRKLIFKAHHLVDDIWEVFEQ